MDISEIEYLQVELSQTDTLMSLLGEELEDLYTVLETSDNKKNELKNLKLLAFQLHQRHNIMDTLQNVTNRSVKGAAEELQRYINEYYAKIRNNANQHD